MLKIENITKSYNKRLILDNLTFSVKAGSVCGVLGLNGAGKSTLLKILTHLVLPDSGKVLFNDVDILNQNQNTEFFGSMIESPAFYGDLTGFQNLKALSILIDGVSDQKIYDTLRFVGLFEQSKIAVKKYSLGMKQRLYFAYAILSNSKLLILDEPFNGIDPVTLSIFKDCIKKLALDGITILISGHSVNDIVELSDSICIIDKGKVAYFSDDIKGLNIAETFFKVVTFGGFAQ